jgi:hypothetical protein
MPLAGEKKDDAPLPVVVLEGPSSFPTFSFFGSGTAGM